MRPPVPQLTNKLTMSHSRFCGSIKGRHALTAPCSPVYDRLIEPCEAVSARLSEDPIKVRNRGSRVVLAPHRLANGDKIRTGIE